MSNRTLGRKFVIFVASVAILGATTLMASWTRAQSDFSRQITALEETLSGLIGAALNEQRMLPADAQKLRHEYGFPQLIAEQENPSKEAGHQLDQKQELRVFRDDSGKHEWFSVILMRAVERLDYERFLPRPVARWVVNVRAGRPIFAADALDRFRQLPGGTSQIPPALGEPEALGVHGRRDQETLERLCHWVTKIFPFANASRPKDFLIISLELLPPLNGFTHKFGPFNILIVGPAPTLAERDLLIVHEALHTPVASLLQSDPSLRAALRSSSHLMSKCVAKEQTLSGYNDWESLFSESLVRTLSRRFTKAEIGPTWELESNLDQIVNEQLLVAKRLDLIKILESLEKIDSNARENVEHV